MHQQPGHRFKRTRLAPTPSGYLHLGNAASFVITAGLARRYGAGILLRIDDLDRERVRPEYVQDIFDTLQFLEIPWDEGPRNGNEWVEQYSQVHRMAMYTKMLDGLVASGNLFACTCSRSRLAEAGTGAAYPGTCRNKNIPLDRAGVSWRLKIDTGRVLTVHDLFAGEKIFHLPSSMKDFIVRKKDGFPSYQLTSVADDLYFGTDLIVRGEDLFDSTLAQLYLASCLPANPFGEIVFFHHPLIREKDGIKLSKTAGDTSVRYLREHGKTREDIFMMIARAFGRVGEPRGWEALYEVLMNGK